MIVISLRLCVKNKKQRDPIHLLYLGRRHPLKGFEYLEAVVAELNSNPKYLFKIWGFILYPTG